MFKPDIYSQGAIITLPCIYRSAKAERSEETASTANEANFVNRSAMAERKKEGVCLATINGQLMFARYI